MTARSQALPVSRQAWSWEHRRPWKRSDITDQMVVAATADAARQGDDGLLIYPSQILVSVLGVPMKVAQFAFHRSKLNGYVGPTGRYPAHDWVTDRGRALFE